MKPYTIVWTVALLGAAACAAAASQAVVSPAAAPLPAPGGTAPVVLASNAAHSSASTNAPAVLPIDIRKLPSNTVFTVQLGAFTTSDRAFTVFWELSPKVPSLQLVAPFGRDKLYRLRYGAFATYDAAHAAAEKLRKENIDCFVTPVGMPEVVVNDPKGE